MFTLNKAHDLMVINPKIGGHGITLKLFLLKQRRSFLIFKPLIKLLIFLFK